jgi:hypothetical protein
MRHAHRRNARACLPGVSEGVCRADQIEHASVAQSADQRQRKPFVDKFGNRHAETVLTNWSPQMLRIMGIRRLDEKGGA